MSLASERKALESVLGCDVPEYGEPPRWWSRVAMTRTLLRVGMLDVDRCLQWWTNPDQTVRQCTARPGCGAHHDGLLRSRLERVPGACSVYLMACEDRVKIGMSDDPATRAVALSSAVGVRVTVQDAVLCWSRGDAANLERVAHSRCDHARLLGEWFKGEPARRAWSDLLRVIVGRGS